MTYKIIVSPRAQKEIENAVEYYGLYSSLVPKRFVVALLKAYKTLSQTPFFEYRYKEIMSFKIDIFPYSLFYVVDEKNKKIRILSCFHNKRNPRNQP